MVEETFNNYQSSTNCNEISNDYIDLSIPVELNFQEYDNNNEPSSSEDNIYDNRNFNITSFLTNNPSKADALAAEFEYYKNLLPDLIILQFDPEKSEVIQQWIEKLSMPAYNIIQLRDKRNRFMLMLCFALIADNLCGPFIEKPPIGILPNIREIQRPQIQQFEWELDEMWNTQLENRKKQVTSARRIRQCPVHRKACPKDITINKSIGEFLDKKFQLLLYIYKSYIQKLETCWRLRVMKCIQTLCKVDQSYCSVAKDIRNKYMIILYRYLKNQSLIDEFEYYLSQQHLIFQCCDCFAYPGCRVFCENYKAQSDLLR